MSIDDPLHRFVLLGQKMQADVDAVLSGKRDEIKLLDIDAQHTSPLLPRTFELKLELTEFQAFAMAELCKRIGWQDVRQLSVADAEARNMIQATDRIRSALELAGVCVR